MTRSTAALTTQTMVTHSDSHRACGRSEWRSVRAIRSVQAEMHPCDMKCPRRRIEPARRENRLHIVALGRTSLRPTRCCGPGRAEFRSDPTDDRTETANTDRRRRRRAPGPSRDVGDRAACTRADEAPAPRHPDAASPCMVDQGIEDSFPAGDPPPWTSGIARSGPPVAAEASGRDPFVATVRASSAPTSRGVLPDNHMQLTVRDEEKQFDRQTHAYAEYRVFSTLASDGSSHRAVTVTLTRMDGTGSRYPVQCTVAVTMSCGDVARVRAPARHPYAAIDRAAALIGKAVQRRRAQSVTLSTPGVSRAGQGDRS